MLGMCGAMSWGLFCLKAWAIIDMSTFSIADFIHENGQPLLWVVSKILLGVDSRNGCPFSLLVL